MKKSSLQSLVRKNIRSLRAYEAKEIPCRVKLDANESPLGFSGREIIKAFSTVRTNRYPDPEAKELKKIIGKTYGVAQRQILQGNGSDELIYYLITTFGGPVLYPVPTFSMYGIIAQALNEKTIPVPLDSAFDLDLKKTLDAVKRKKPKIIFLSSPNNPTGNCFSAEKTMTILERSQGVVVVDEAYQPFSSKKGFLPLLKDYPNLVIMRTLSKIGLAALRLGFLVADPSVIEQVNKVRLPFNVNAISQALATAVLKNTRQFHAVISSVVSERSRLLAEMLTLRGIAPFPSEANFILFRVRNPDSIYTGLLNEGVLVRNMHPSVKGCLRVTIGTRDENNAFLAALRAVTTRSTG